MLLEAFGQAILKWLRVPPGASVRHANDPTTSSGNVENEYIDAILDITTDDICIGESPLSITYENSTPEIVQLKLDSICDEFNDVVKDVCRDLLEVGFSVYDAHVSEDNRLCLLPELGKLEFYLTKDKRVVVYETDDTKRDKVNLANKIIFINYTARDLEKVEDGRIDVPESKDIKFKISPRAMQLASSTKTLTGLNNCEDSIAKYRALLRPLRWANVDIGTASGDQQQEVTESISQGINANSSSLSNGAAYSEFDDALPIMPNRKGIGKPEIVSDVPSANISDLADLGYWLKKLTLLTRFPMSYLDFSQPLGETAVSLLRGDLRYQKLCKAVGSLIIKTFNKYLQTSKFKEYNPTVALTTIPTTEDDDVVDAMDKYVDLVQKIDGYILGEGDQFDPVAALHRLEVLQSLYATSTNSPAITEWFAEYREYIEGFMNSSNQNEKEDDGGLSEFDEGFDTDTGGGEPTPTSNDFDLYEGSETPGDVEILQPQT